VAEPSPARTADEKTPRRRLVLPPGLLRREDAAAYCGVEVTTWDRHNAAGKVPEPVRLGGAVCWRRWELRAWIDHECPPRAEWAPVWKALRAARYAGRGGRGR
jgi:predicted DNA-binding transcriptional regulator AlpA